MTSLRFQILEAEATRIARQRHPKLPPPPQPPMSHIDTRTSQDIDYILMKEQHISEDQYHMKFLVAGVPQSGKSSLMKQIANLCTHNQSDYYFSDGPSANGHGMSWSKRIAHYIIKCIQYLIQTLPILHTHSDSSVQRAIHLINSIDLDHKTNLHGSTSSGSSSSTRDTSGMFITDVIGNAILDIYCLVPAEIALGASSRQLYDHIQLRSLAYYIQRLYAILPRPSSSSDSKLASPSSSWSWEPNWKDILHCPHVYPHSNFKGNDNTGYSIETYSGVYENRNVTLANPFGQRSYIRKYVTQILPSPTASLACATSSYVTFIAIDGYHHFKITSWYMSYLCHCMMYQ
jgi:hypothetical protein